ncbi:MAG: class Ib ribonucleoside-diphosphate reductase assembly flavoprotein NrdI [bacterium]|nr:class Ib ribonucleoside-diphosphate reductase assembly flavoprotein NrdI [bacterium]
MKVVYASRTGNVQKLIDKLALTDSVKITSGEEKVDGDYIVVTYTDGQGIIPPVVEQFLDNNKAGLKGAAVSGNQERHPDTFCQAAEKIQAKYGCPIIVTFAKEGDDAVVEAIKAVL